MTTKQQQLAVAAIRADRELHRADLKYGMRSEEARQALRLAERALAAAEAAGCTIDDYEFARRTA
ncbi:hypothetical protein [Streptomyces fradiae]|uniref:hypothetical protein n=1 Tax=Streptomyces fradiae TaxID=1906 RepID=UPI003700B52C